MTGLAGGLGGPGRGVVWRRRRTFVRNTLDAWDGRSCDRSGLEPVVGAGQTGDGSTVAEKLDFDEQLAAIARELVHEPDTQHTLQRIVEEDSLGALNLYSPQPERV